MEKEIAKTKVPGDHNVTKVVLKTTVENYRQKGCQHVFNWHVYNIYVCILSTYTLCINMPCTSTCFNRYICYTANWLARFGVFCALLTWFGLAGAFPFIFSCRSERLWDHQELRYQILSCITIFDKQASYFEYLWMRTRCCKIEFCSVCQIPSISSPFFNYPFLFWFPVFSTGVSGIFRLTSSKKSPWAAPPGSGWTDKEWKGTTLAGIWAA